MKMKETFVLLAAVLLTGCASVHTLTLNEMSDLSVSDPLLSGTQWQYKGSDSEWHYFRHHRRKGARVYPLDFRIKKTELYVPQEHDLTHDRLRWISVRPSYNEAGIITGIEQNAAHIFQKPRAVPENGER
jgi:uncharacterized protein YceK